MFNIDQTTIDKEEEGIWAPFKGSEFLIASSGSMKFQRLFNKLQMPHRKALEKGRLDPSIQVDIMARSLATASLLGWRDVVDSAGNEVEYSFEKAYKALKNNSELREFVTEVATDLSNYVDEEKEELGKSAEKSLDGKSSSEAA